MPACAPSTSARLFPDKIIPFNQGNGDLDEPAFARAIAAGLGDLRIFDDALKSFVEMGRRHAFKPIVSYVPSAHNAYRRVVRFNDPELAEILPIYGDVLRSYFRDRAARFDFEFVDMTEAMRTRAAELGAQGLLYFERNLHLTGLGHDVLADQIGRRIRKLNGR